MLRPPVSEQLQGFGLETLAVIWSGTTDRRHAGHPFESINGLKNTGERCPLSTSVRLLAEMSALNLDKLVI
jgi:hypothetical protein